MGGPQIQHSQESLRALAQRYGVNPKTVAKWKARSPVADAFSLWRTEVAMTAQRKRWLVQRFNGAVDAGVPRYPVTNGHASIGCSFQSNLQ